jgi:hypothetical protein
MINTSLSNIFAHRNLKTELEPEEPAVARQRLETMSAATNMHAENVRIVEYDVLYAARAKTAERGSSKQLRQARLGSLEPLVTN